MRVIALTGGIGSGKSLAAQYFAGLGAFVLDSDKLARQAIERGSLGFDQVVAIFGGSILEDGEIDRKALGAIIFRDAVLKKKLESIIHPWIRSEFESAVARMTGTQTLIYEIPLLFETGSAERFDTVITVEAKMQLRIERLLARGLDMGEIEARMSAQASREERISIAHIVIENNGSADDLLRQVERVWDGLTTTFN